MSISGDYSSLNGGSQRAQTMEKTRDQPHGLVFGCSAQPPVNPGDSRGKQQEGARLRNTRRRRRARRTGFWFPWRWFAIFWRHASRGIADRWEDPYRNRTITRRWWRGARHRRQFGI